MPKACRYFLVFIFFLFLFSVDIKGQEPQVITIKDYVTPDVSNTKVKISSGETFYTIPGKEKGEYIVCKNDDCSSYEKRFILPDGSIGLQGEYGWEWEERPNLTFRYEYANGSLASWLPAEMKVGETWKSGDFEVSAYVVTEEGLVPTDAKYAGITGGVEMKLESVGPIEFTVGDISFTLADVAKIRIESGPGHTEVFYYAKGIGIVGWESGTLGVKNLPISAENLPLEQIKEVTVNINKVIQSELPAVKPINKVSGCLAGQSKPQDGTFRPLPCEGCSLDLPDGSADSCTKPQDVTSTGKYRIPDLESCSYNDSWIARFSWGGDLTINTENSKVPFAGYSRSDDPVEEIESPESAYLAEYFEGTWGYGEQWQDLSKADTPEVKKDIVKKVLENGGVWRKLAPKDIQDDYKIKAITEDKYDYDVNTSKGIKTMQEWNDPLKGGRYKPIDPKNSNSAWVGRMPPDKTSKVFNQEYYASQPNPFYGQYLKYYQKWQKIDPWGIAWHNVPMFSREDSPGKITAEIAHSPGDLHTGGPGQEQVDEHIVDFPMSVPHLERLYQSSLAVSKILMPLLKNQVNAVKSIPQKIASNKLLQPGVLGSEAVFLAQGEVQQPAVCHGMEMWIDEHGEGENKTYAVKARYTGPPCGNSLSHIDYLSVEYFIDGESVYSAADGCMGGCGVYFISEADGGQGLSLNDVLGGKFALPKNLYPKGSQKLSVSVAVHTPDQPAENEEGDFGECNNYKQTACSCVAVNYEEGDVVCKVMPPPPPPAPTCNDSPSSVNSCQAEDAKEDINKNDEICCSGSADYSVINQQIVIYSSTQAKKDAELQESIDFSDCLLEHWDEPERCEEHPFHSTDLQRSIGFKLELPYLEKIWEQTAAYKTAVFNIFKPASFNPFGDYKAKTGIKYKWDSNDFGSAPFKVSAKADEEEKEFYFEHLGGVQWAKKCVSEVMLLPKDKQSDPKYCPSL